MCVSLSFYLLLTAQLERKHKGTGKTASGNEEGVSPPSAVKKKKCKNLEVPFSNDRHVSVPERKRERRMKQGKEEVLAFQCRLDDGAFSAVSAFLRQPLF